MLQAPLGHPLESGEQLRWTVQNGTLEGHGASKSADRTGGWDGIQTTHRFGNFHLRFNTKIAYGNTAGLRFVIPVDTQPGAVPVERMISMKVMIYGGGETQRTGNILVEGVQMETARIVPVPPGDFFPMDIIREGRTITVMVNNQFVSSHSEARLVGKGYITIDAAGGSTVRMKDMLISSN
jgi:hypothetical protein